MSGNIIYNEITRIIRMFIYTHYRDEIETTMRNSFNSCIYYKYTNFIKKVGQIS